LSNWVGQAGARLPLSLEMTTTKADSGNPLQRAREQMVAVHREHESVDPKGSDTGTLARMLVHMGNIEKSVTASMQDHVNASKRLLDFGNAIERMARNLSPSFPKTLGASMGELVESLREAGLALGSSSGPPSWASAAQPAAN
jgi:transcriptional regulator GlxA family with amidase domain